jgi:hypothetical protein
MQIQNFTDCLKGDSFGAKTVNISIDITNITLRCQFRKSSKTGDLMKEAVITKVTANQFIIGDFIVDWEADLTYYYDVQFTYPSGKVKTYFGGSFKVIQDVTQPL